MSIKTLISLGAIVVAIVVGIAAWGFSYTPPSQASTPVFVVPPTVDPATVAARRAAKKLCHDNALAYDPHTREPDLAGCDFDREPGGAVSGNYTGLDFTGANLADARLGGLTYPPFFSNANFTGANLTGADLSYAQLDGANFTDANLGGALFYTFDLLGNAILWASFNEVIWANTVCPDGTNSDTNGGTCAENLYVSQGHRPQPTPEAPSSS